MASGVRRHYFDHCRSDVLADRKICWRQRMVGPRSVRFRFSLKALIATVTCIAILIAAYLWFGAGITVIVHNQGDSPLSDLEVHIAGVTYELGDVTSGSTRKCTVKPVSESHVEITYQLPDGGEAHTRLIVISNRVIEAF